MDTRLYLTIAGIAATSAGHAILPGKHAVQEASLTGSDFRDEEDWLYVRIAEDRLDRRLSEVVSEGDLMRRYGVGRTHLQKVLLQIAGEGQNFHNGNMICFSRGSFFSYGTRQ